MHQQAAPDAPASLAERGKWPALIAALLGWMFDGLEMGIFPVVAGPALRDLLGTADPAVTNRWFGVITAMFLVGAATGGVVFGWLGDRVGRVRAMTLSVATYAIFSGLCGLATNAETIAVLRFVAALGMGGEWALGVALVMEIWPDSSRGLLAGIIGSAANLGYMLVAVIGMGLSAVLGSITSGLASVGLSATTVEWLTRNDGWRILLLLGVTPALLTFFIRLFVPESHRWEEEQRQGRTSHWVAADLWAVVVGAAAACGMIALWAYPEKIPVAASVAGSVVALAIVLVGYLHPTVNYLRRAEGGGYFSPTVKRMLLGALLSGIPLMATWGSVQLAPKWAHEIANPAGSLDPYPMAKYHAQFWSALGASVGTVMGSVLGAWLGRRVAYFALCVGALAATQLFFRTATTVDASFFAMVCLVGALSASFYGWLPLYLPELFRTGVRATGQGFGFNFGRILAAVGGLQLATLTTALGGTAAACQVLCLVYVAGMVVIWFAPETKGKPLPE